jgi:hypothetical protein
MSSTIKNAIIFISIGAALFLIYIFFIKSDEVAPVGLVTSPSLTNTPVAANTGQVGGEFLKLLLSVKSIKLNDSIFSNPAFLSLSDSSILLVQDGSEGRANPFAPLGDDKIINKSAPTLETMDSAPITLPTVSDTPANPPSNTKPNTTGGNKKTN